jgi:hypothetical protein
MMNEIVLGEESDKFPELKALTGVEYMSHAEMYERAMNEVGADTRPYRRFLCNLAERRQPFRGVPVDPRISRFVRGTLNACASRQPDHVTASAFLFGREDLIPDMFQRVLAALPHPKSTHPSPPLHHPSTIADSRVL